MTHPNDVSTPNQGVAWPPKFDLLGVQVSSTKYDELVPIIVAAGKQKQPAIVSCHAVHAIVTASSDPELRDRVNSFEAITPDGQPVRWGLNLLYRLGMKDRVYGPELMLRLCKHAAQEGVSIFLYGSTESVLESLIKNLNQQIPNLKIAGFYSPPFRPLSDDEEQILAEKIRTSGAGITFIGLGCPKQDHFAFLHREAFGTVQVCVGAAFDFHAGTKPMAPKWLQNRGLEWFFRLVCEPSRLLKRYAVTNTVFVIKFATIYAKRTILRS